MMSVRSLLRTALTKCVPIPGTAKTFSTTNEPVMAMAAAGPRKLNTGRNAFFRACLSTTRI